MHIAADPEAPVACDMSTASDTPAERLAEYRRLFSRALLRRERPHGAVVFVFRADSAPAVADLARREAHCCPFLEYRVEQLGDQVIWTIADPLGRASAILDEFHALTGGVRSRRDGRHDLVPDRAGRRGRGAVPGGRGGPAP